MTIMLEILKHVLVPFHTTKVMHYHPLSLHCKTKFTQQWKNREIQQKKGLSILFCGESLEGFGSSQHRT